MTAAVTTLVALFAAWIFVKEWRAGKNDPDKHELETRR